MKDHARIKLDVFGLEALCEAVYEGNSLTSIAEQIDVSKGSLIAWIASDPDRSARVNLARLETSRIWDEKAERGIELAGDDFELAKARDLAHHYRWRAAKIAPKLYGDKLQQEHTGADGKALTFNILTAVPLPDAP